MLRLGSFGVGWTESEACWGRRTTGRAARGRLRWNLCEELPFAGTGYRDCRNPDKSAEPLSLVRASSVSRPDRVK